MAVRQVNGVRLITDLNAAIHSGRSKGSVVFALQVNSTPDRPLKSAGGWFNVPILCRSSQEGFACWCSGVNPDLQVVQLTFQWMAVGRGSARTIYNVYPNTPYFFSLGYDGDAGSQYLIANGVMIPFGTIKGALYATSNRVEFGTWGAADRDFTLDKVGVFNDYLVTLDDARAHIRGASPATINAGLDAWAWPCDGPVGQTPASGDAALKNIAGDGSLPLIPGINAAAPGSSLTYAEPLVFVSQSGYKTPRVCSSGESIEILPVKTGTTTPLRPTAGGIGAMPSVTFGGRTIRATAANYDPLMEAIQFLLPERVPPDVPATFDAEDGFFATSLGAASGCAGLPMLNDSGRAKYWDRPRTQLVGINNQSPGPTYWAYDSLTRNLLNRIGVDMNIPDPPALRPDGTLNGNLLGQIWGTGSQESGDEAGVPGRWGDYVVSWRNTDRTRPKLMELTSDFDGVVVERTEYRLDNDADGENTRVYTFKQVKYPIVLQAAVGTDDDTLSLDTVANFIDGGKMVASLGGELIRIMTVDRPNKRVKVQRKQFGSQAEAHPALRSGTVAPIVNNARIYVKISGFAATPDGSGYAPDAVVYGPGDFQLPATPGPFRVDRSPEHANAPSAYMAENLANVGGVRYMGKDGVFSPTAEPEHIRLTTDLYPGTDDKVKVAFRIVKAEPMDFTRVPFTLSHQHDRHGVTYPVTLLVPIDTAPPPETVETIHLAYTDAAPVIKGTRLFADGECFRVLDVMGQAVQIVRGSDGTTPAPHAAGPIQAGFQIPITSPAQYRAANSVALHVTTDVPHGLRAGQWSKDQASNDLNPLARFAATLTEAAPAGSKTIKASVDAANWPYVAQFLNLDFGSFAAVVDSADPSTGVVTLKAPLPAALAAGTVGRGSARGFFCVSDDGALTTWTQPAPGVIGWYPTGQRTALVVLYCYLKGQSGVLVGASQALDPTPQVVNKVDQTVIRILGPGTAYAPETLAAATATVPGAVHWANIPINASADMVRALARKTIPKLPKGKHRVVVETGNETWNYVFPFPAVSLGCSQIYGYSSGTDAAKNDWFVVQSAVNRAIYADEAARLGWDAADVLLTIPWQTGNLGDMLARCRALNTPELSTLPDVVSTHSYAGPAAYPLALQIARDATNGQRWDFFVMSYEYYYGPGQASRQRADAAAYDEHAAATGTTPLFWTYEGGVTNVLPAPPNGIRDATVYPQGDNADNDAMYDPNAYNAHVDLMQIDKMIYRMDGKFFFNLTQPPAWQPAGSGGSELKWGFHAFHGQPNGRGDGSDGKHDNRTTTAVAGLPASKSPLVSIHDLCVSVRGQWMVDWNKAQHPDPTPDPDPEPDPDPPPRTEPDQPTALVLDPTKTYLISFASAAE